MEQIDIKDVPVFHNKAMRNGHFKVCAIIVAAGNGVRMGTDKMCSLLGGMSVIARTAQIFFKSRLFDEIIIVASKKNTEFISEEMKKYNVCAKIVLGGATRGESSYNGIRATNADIVLIHDGARPFTEKAIIKNVIEGAIDCGAAAPGVTPKDTIKLINDDGMVDCTLPREKCVNIQTPQGFNRDIILNAYEKHGFSETDDCAVAERSGVSIKIVDGSYKNIKLTTPEDLLTAAKFIENWGTDYAYWERI